MKNTQHPQRLANWSLSKNESGIVSDRPDGIFFGGANDDSSINHYGGILVGESIQKEVAEMIISDHELIKELSTITETDRDNLCDIVWWLKGYKKGANDNFQNCEFHEDHLNSLDTTVKVLRIVLNKLSK